MPVIIALKADDTNMMVYVIYFDYDWTVCHLLKDVHE